MRYPVFLIGLLIILFSCKSSLLISDVNEQNLKNSPATYHPDSSIINLVAPYKQKLEADMTKVVAISTEKLIRRMPESKLTDLIADVLMEEGDNYCKTHNKNFSPDMAFMNYYGIRSSLPKGKITAGDIYELLPFENVLVLVEVSGETMEKFIAEIAKQGSAGVAGIKLGIKDGKIGDLTIGGKRLNKRQNYWIVTNDYIAGGGDGMSMLKNRKAYIDTGLKLRDVFMQNLEHDYQIGRKIVVKLDGRMYNE